MRAARTSGCARNAVGRAPATDKQHDTRAALGVMLVALPRIAIRTRYRLTFPIDEPLAVYGTIPTLEPSGPDDASDLGRWIPTIAVDQFAATLATWFGADATQFAAVLPNLSAFSPSSLGFI